MFDAQAGGSKYGRKYCHQDCQTQLGGREDTDDNIDTLAGDIEADLEEDESIILENACREAQLELCGLFLC